MLKRFLLRALGAVVGLPKGAASHLPAISNHVDSILGEPKQHLHENYSPDIHVDLMHYAATADRGFQYLVTSGMSDRPMTDGGDPVEEPHMELVLALPSDWDISAEGFKNPAVFQPVKLMKQLARYPHANRTYFAKGHTVQIGDEPLLQPMEAVMLMPPLLVPELSEPLVLANGERIRFMGLYLLHEDELKLKLEDVEQLVGFLAEHGIREMYDLKRASVCR
ncbi:MAG TPA: suppressor of fused domain protein [Candidatus Solibacter sp.]|nr:suppressor of fused domain protein [Candidatus Solibacter sp.]